MPRRPENLTRREALATAGAGAVLLTAPTLAGAAGRRREPLARAGKFLHGVASGAPGQREIVLWTRLSEIARSSRLHVEVSRDPDFRRVLLRKEVRAPAIRDFTVRTRIAGKPLKPGEQYFYRFETRTQESPVGRFRTARPADSREPVKVGFFSCQDYVAGYYTGHRALAQEPDLDLVVCLGDYVYESKFYDGPADRADRTGPNGDGEVLSLGDYRDKYRLYRTDPDLQALHAAHPFVAVWDDHEVEDNYAADDRDPAKKDPPKIPHRERQRNGYLAFFEYMPRVRVPPSFQIYGSVPLGAAEVLLLDERQYRDPQACGGEFLRPCPDAETGNRTFLGAQQRQWFVDRVRRSPSPWKIVGNQLMIMSLDGAPGQTLNVDAWDGYGAERRAVLEPLADAGVKGLTFLTGDIHTFFAGDVGTNGRSTGRPIATEFVGGSVTSLGLEDQVPPATLTTLESGLRVNNPHIKYADFRRRGYGIAEARATELRVTYKGPQTTQQRNAPVSTYASFRVGLDAPRVERA